MVDTKLFYMTSFLIMVGVVFTYSLSIYTVVYFGAGEFNFVLKQSIVAFVSIVSMWVISRQNPDVIIPIIGFSMFFLFIIAMITMYFLPETLVTSAGGARRWIRMPGFSIAPVEFFKIGFIFFISWSFERKISPHEDSLHTKKELMILLPYFLFIFMPLVFLIFILQNDLGQTVLIAILLLILSLLAGVRFQLFFSLIFIALIILIATIYFTDKMIRVEVWWANSQNFFLPLFPDVISDALRVDSLPEPYQINNSLNAIKNGGFLGVGLGNGNLKYGYLSEVHTDFILAGITEELGYVFLIFITSIMYMVIHRMFVIANRSQKIVYYLFSAGMATLISFAFLINALGISGVTPIKGMAVPFLSYGGSSTLALSIGVGMVLSISKKVKLNE